MCHFFLNQQFVTRGARADRSSYVVTTYKATKPHDKEIKENKNEKKKKEKEKDKLT